MIVETTALSHMFAGREVVRDVGLQVPMGAAMVLLGANGAGKTSLLRLLLNILRPSKGGARLFGRDSRCLGPEDFQRIGYAAESQILPGRLSVSAYFDYLRPLYERWDGALEQHLRRHFGLPGGQRIDLLSHGASMTLRLATALAFRPTLLILDEPLGGLDQDVREQVLDILIDRAGDTTILMATQEITDIDRFATHVAFMADGRLLFQEETGTLAARMRDVRVQVGEMWDLPATLPESWLTATRTGRTLGFIDSGFVSEAVLRQQLADCGIEIGGLDIRPLALRDIAVPLIRAQRGETGQ
ncbi:ATP-binding cassette domain-containing protein [Niveispirillum sp.]|uniref:ATP-binding cassette domain-containing protein n=1 Tax=Niveispirillum sp. TaxID=1917217 RepID=UPI001B6DA8CC|nr:ATP-binding cassette domain-containing protein [Niveispirillum sp.]MBP7340590.1 ATP-binding cassette domain-containing protein [Niveispirillum sp.]